MLPQLISINKKEKSSMIPQPNQMESNIFNTHPLNIKNNSFDMNKKGKTH
jgi:hypothetical protein